MDKIVQQELEASVGPTGITGRAKGYRLVDIAMIGMALGWAWGAWELKAHAGDSDRQNAAVVRSINDGSDRMVKALEKMADEQRAATMEQKKTTAAVKEIACLNDPAMKNVSNAREVCKRLTGVDR